MRLSLWGLPAEGLERVGWQPTTASRSPLPDSHRRGARVARPRCPILRDDSRSLLDQGHQIEGRFRRTRRLTAGGRRRGKPRPQQRATGIEPATFSLEGKPPNCRRNRRRSRPSEHAEPNIAGCPRALYDGHGGPEWPARMRKRTAQTQPVPANAAVCGSRKGPSSRRRSCVVPTAA